MSIERYAHTATLLTDGKVLVAGEAVAMVLTLVPDIPFCFAPIPFATAEVFDPPRVLGA